MDTVTVWGRAWPVDTVPVWGTWPVGTVTVWGRVWPVDTVTVWGTCLGGTEPWPAPVCHSQIGLLSEEEG